MKDRAQAAAMLNKMLDDVGYKLPKEKGRQWHFGRQELRVFMDWLYEGPPAGPDEEIKTER